MDATVVVQLQEDVVGGAVPDRRHHVGQAHHAFVNHDGNAGGRAEPGEPCEVPSDERLLEAEQVVPFQFGAHADRLTDRVPLIRVRRHQCARRHRRAGRGHPFNVGPRVHPDLHLDQTVAGTLGLPRGLGDCLGIIDTDTAKHEQTIAPGAAEQPVQRLAELFPRHVEAGDVYRALGRGVPDRKRSGHNAVNVLDLARIQSEQLWSEHVSNGRKRRLRRLTIPSW